MAKLVHYIDAFLAMLATLRLRLTCNCLLLCLSCALCSVSVLGLCPMPVLSDLSLLKSLTS